MQACRPCGSGVSRDAAHPLRDGRYHCHGYDVREAMKVKVLLLGGLLLCVSLAASAAPTPRAKAEIAGLMDALSNSGCRFQRNGSWYDAAEARAHLQRKYDYLLKKDKVDTAGQFIERAASASSMSGRAYRVQCNGKEQDAASWFNGQLKRLRSSPTGAMQERRESRNRHQ